MMIDDNTALIRQLYKALNAGIEATNALRPDAFVPHEVFCVAGTHSTMRLTPSSIPPCSKPCRIFSSRW
jgi:hypothetical protein